MSIFKFNDQSMFGLVNRSNQSVSVPYILQHRQGENPNPCCVQGQLLIRLQSPEWLGKSVIIFWYSLVNAFTIIQTFR